MTTPRVPNLAIDDELKRAGVSKPINPAPTCRFLERCPWAADVCHNNEHPPLEEKAPGHWAACWHAERAQELT